MTILPNSAPTVSTASRLSILPLLLTLAGSGLSAADVPLPADPAVLPLETLLERIDLGEDARILEIKTEMKRGREQYEIEYVTPSGRIREVYVDPLTGEPWGGHGDHKEDD